MMYRKYLMAAATGLCLAAAPALAEDLVIGLSMNKTGPLAANGTTNDVAVNLAVEEINAAGGINGNMLKVNIFDTAGDPKQAVTATRQFAKDDGALAIIGPFSSGECRVAFPVGEREGIVQISNASSAPGLTEGFDYAFRNTSDELTQFRRLITAMESHEILPANVAIIYATDDFISKSLGEQAFPTAFEEAGIPVVATIGFQLQAFDLAPQVTELKQANPEAVAIGGTVEAVQKVVREMRRQGVTSRVLASGVAADPHLAEKLGADGDGLLYPTYYYHKLNDEVLSFQEKFAAATTAAGHSKTIPQHADASAYDVVHILAEALRRAEVTGDPAKLEEERDAIRDQLKSMEAWNYSGILGESHFSEVGDAALPTHVVEIRDHDFHLLDTITE
ncbi:ABC transporter substrate-binding protein [Alphaproteobacteria bacterium KMM 3653]|uniref:ABC transporter substrate-binding protein n=1 Tax=Harenicola maris TaxID=2841044 RepID=A0AAP2G3H6_9RHOB|nr:ABC transporter substrate-binding protein [Harenicola maris]